MATSYDLSSPVNPQECIVYSMDQHQNEFFWSGSRWVNDESLAHHFESLAQANQTASMLHNTNSEISWNAEVWTC